MRPCNLIGVFPAHFWRRKKRTHSYIVIVIIIEEDKEEEEEEEDEMKSIYFVRILQHFFSTETERLQLIIQRALENLSRVDS